MYIMKKTAYNFLFKSIVRREKREVQIGTIGTVMMFLGTLIGLLSCFKLQKTG
jgi:hypothetical protein